jgi:hypothetical protein
LCVTVYCSSSNPPANAFPDVVLWCEAQLKTCPIICGGSTSTNTCDPTTFTYSCICSNGTEPDCTAYMDTLPFYICQATFAQCINAHPNDAAGQATCTSNEKCAALNATEINAAAASSSSSGTFSTSRVILTANTLISSIGYTTISETPISSTAPSLTTGSIPAVTVTVTSLSNSTGSLTPGAEAGIGAGVGLVGLLCLGVLAFYIRKRQKKGRRDTHEGVTDEKEVKRLDISPSQRHELDGQSLYEINSEMESQRHEKDGQALYEMSSSTLTSRASRT